MMPPEFEFQRLPSRAVISVVGEGALAWLHNLATSDVVGLDPGEAAYGALLSPQGKIQADFFVVATEQGALIDCAASQQADLLKRLKLYRLRAKLEIKAEPDLGVGAADVKPGLPHCFLDPRLARLGWRVIAPIAELPAGQGYDFLRLAAGLGDSDGDIGVDQTFPHEANFDQFGGVSFTKGCYVGQEVVSRMQHRGTARNRMLPVRFSGGVVEAGAEIVSGGTIIGRVLSTQDGIAIAMIRIDRLAEAPALLKAGDAQVHVMKPEWIKYEVVIPVGVQ